MFLVTQKELCETDPSDIVEYEYSMQLPYEFMDPAAYAGIRFKRYSDYFDAGFLNNFDEIKWRILLYLPDLRAKIEELNKSIYKIGPLEQLSSDDDTYGKSGFFNDIHVIYQQASEFRSNLEKAIAKYMSI